ncbi:hypothetical protein PBY51_024520 [Eleginops maclovinus]|uniref:Uncharacterized protein n=1 Tax=Eleginops maclovinus TaxID=56733 RepID=A0AAN8AW14_ELEMC|nr:hypothetical protein PBY51_024520 [Eleginops maclovinus]
MWNPCQVLVESSAQTAPADGSLLCTALALFTGSPLRAASTKCLNTVSGIFSRDEPLKLVFALRGELENSVGG